MAGIPNNDCKARSQFTLLARIVAGMLSITGVAILAVYLDQKLLDRAFDSYETTEGTVMSSEVRTLPSGPVRMVNATRTLLLSYRYEVDGVAHIGHTLSPQQVGTSLDAGLVEPLARQFPVGALVRVHFNRRNPDQAYVLRSTGSNLWVLITGLLLCATAAGLVFGAGRIMDQLLGSCRDSRHRA